MVNKDQDIKKFLTNSVITDLVNSLNKKMTNKSKMNVVNKLSKIVWITIVDKSFARVKNELIKDK